MFHVNFFGGTEADMAPSGFTALNVFGGCELRRPTLASQLLMLRHRESKPKSTWDKLMGGDKNLILTAFGGTVLVAPTMVEEYNALAGLVRSGSLAPGEFEMLLDRLTASGAEHSTYRTLTVFGACVVRYPSAKKETKALDAAVKTGTLTERVRVALDEMIGSPPEARARSLGQLAGAPA